MDALVKETVQTQDEALTDLYRKIRPADTPTPEAGKNLLDSFYFNTKRYDLARVGRYKINRKLVSEKDVNDRSLSREDIIATIKYLVTLHAVRRPSSRASATARTLTCAWTSTISTTSATVVSARSAS